MAEEGGISFNFKAFLFKSLNYWPLVMAGILISLGYAYYKVRYFVPQYSVSARILVKDEYSSWGQEYFLPGMELISARNKLINEMGVIKSFPVISRAMDLSDEFRVFYYRHGNVKTTEYYQNPPFQVHFLDSNSLMSNDNYHYFYLKVLDENHYKLSRDQEFATSRDLSFGEIFDLDGRLVKIELRNRVKSAWDEHVFGFSVNNMQQLVQFYQATTNIVPENKQSSILIISRRGTNVYKEIDFLNNLIDAYILQGLDQGNQIANNTLKFVENQIEGILDTLIKAEMKLQNFKSNINAKRIPLEGNELFQTISDLEKEKIEKDLLLEFYSILEENFKKDDSAFVVIPSFVRNPLIVNALTELNSINLELSKTQYYSTGDNSNIKLLTNQRKDIRIKIKESLSLEKRIVKNELKGIQQQINSLDKKITSIPASEREFVNIQRTYQLNSDLYTYLLRKRSEAAIALASNISKVQILDKASLLRSSYIGQNKPRLFIISILFGVAIPLLIIFLLDYFNTKVIDKDDLVRFTSIPIIGVIGHNSSLKNLVVLDSPTSLISESIRSIRTQIGFLAKGKEKTVILITSSVSGEGKTFCSMNLAASYGALGKKTVLIGADLRKPKIYGDFEVENNIGLSDLLVGSKELNEVIISTKYQNIDLIISGPIPPNPSELLGGEQTQPLMEKLREIYDVIIIDTPPVGLVTDALLLQNYIDVNLYVVRQRRTNRHNLEIINEYYESGQINNIGIIVNDVRQRSIGYGGYYGYGYGYSYGYGYGQEDRESKSRSKLRSILRKIYK